MYKKDGTLDMRYNGSKNIIIQELKREIMRLNKQQGDKADCAICMEPMRGKVTLKCSHELCPECFAQHARVNNECPFCRDEFAPIVQFQEQIYETHIEDTRENNNCMIKKYVYVFLCCIIIFLNMSNIIITIYRNEMMVYK